jgi:opacity protein-like surface antigen
MRRLVPSVAVLSLVLLASAPARADVTGFIAASRLQLPPAIAASENEKSTRFTKGLAAGVGLVIIGFEFEWATTRGVYDECGRTPIQDYCAPGLSTAMGNVLLQTPHGLMPVQLYGTVGAGGYKERFDVPQFGIDESHYGFGTNVGGGVKIDLAGPLRLRLDYRVFTLANNAFHKTPQRFYAGLNLAF